MRGEVLYFDQERGIGFIAGDDGNRYHFAAKDLAPGHVARKGARVGFGLEGDRARAVTVEGRGAPAAPPPVPGPAATARAAATSVPEIRPAAAVPAPVDPGAGLFGYFRRAVTSGYADFRGRARRKEYWGFVLYFLVSTITAGVAGGMIDVAVGNLEDESPVFAVIFTGIVAIAMFVPGIAVTVRRIHDIGLSGWFVLVGLIPSIGNLILFVFSVLPSQQHENRWGPPPAGAA